MTDPWKDFKNWSTVERMTVSLDEEVAVNEWTTLDRDILFCTYLRVCLIPFYEFFKQTKGPVSDWPDEALDEILEFAIPVFQKFVDLAKNQLIPEKSDDDDE